ncbi:hypothetical protein EMPS_07390 [Entomortierella parvispora]|uniref:Uncharacterized protein n=1 Tax=Entomortierella parvispora TaxID=205924 RepID=A0A9P3HEV4_9FUNG|nr:hypothetical protein EMPS_07390 [Entomortierella parvispora]
MEVEGSWYHRPCFKCMAPNCNTSLTLRNFQVAALEGAELDGMTGRPVKVLVCKDHVPMPKHSLTSDSLSFKHTTSAPKPSVSGIHRSIMGDRTKVGSLAGISSPSSSSPKVFSAADNYGKLRSPRSLDEGSHAPFLKAASSTSSSSKKHEEEKDKKEEEKKQEDEHTSHTSAPAGGGGNTLPKFRNGRFVVQAADPIAVAHKEAEDAQDVHKDDGSFRNIPVHHRDYEHPDAAETKDLSEGHEGRDSQIISSGIAPGGTGAGERDDGLEDNKQGRIFTMKGATTSTDTEETHPKETDLSFSSKLMEQHRRRAGGVHDTDDEKDSAVDDDEWDAAPTDDHSRRERAVGM